MPTDYSELFKGDIVKGAYSQMRISGITVDPSADDFELGLERLEDMAAEWATRNMSQGYVLEQRPDPNTLAGIPRAFKYAFETNLAVRLIADFNKVVPETLLVQARQSASNLSARSAITSQVAYPSRMPRGSGNTMRSNNWNRFFRPSSNIPATTNTLRVGDINDYFEDFSDYLNEFEYITSHIITPDSGLELESSEISGTRINYTLSAPDESSVNAQWVDIQITTVDGRVEKRRVYFSVTE